MKINSINFLGKIRKSENRKVFERRPVALKYKDKNQSDSDCVDFCEDGRNRDCSKFFTHPTKNMSKFDKWKYEREQKRAIKNAKW